MPTHTHRPTRRFVLIAAMMTSSLGWPCRAAENETENLILVTIDGLRWQEVFGGVDQRLVDRERGGVRDVDALRARFWDDSAEQRRRRLMPFFWSTIAKEGQVFGNVHAGGVARVTNGRYFSYPGYNELLSGFADDAIDSNAKSPNRNVTVLEWLHGRPGFRRRVAAFGSWDVFPYILNEERSGIYVNAGWQNLEVFADERDMRQWNLLAGELPRYWEAVRYDVFTAHGALQYLRERRPRVLYVALGETDDWAHDGRYDLYLDAAFRSDQYIQRLWQATEVLDEYRGKTSLVVTTDHGRGDDREGWKSHGATIPGSEYIWIAVLGPDTPPLGLRNGLTVTQAQIAATVAQLLGENFTVSDRRVAAPLPDVVSTGVSP